MPETPRFTKYSPGRTPSISLPRRMGSKGTNDRAIGQLMQQFFTLTASVLENQAELNATTNANLAVEQAKRDYIDFQSGLRHNRDYDSYDELVEEWKSETQQKYEGQLKSSRAQEKFTVLFEQFYTEAYANTIKASVTSSLQDANDMITYLQQEAGRTGSKDDLDRLYTYLFGDPYESDGEILRLGGAVQHGVISEGTAQNLYEETVHAMYVKNAENKSFQLAEKETYQIAIDTLMETDENGNYTNYSELTPAERLTIGENLEAESEDRRTLNLRKEQESQEAAYRRATQLYFAFDEEGNRGLTRRQLFAMRNQLNERDYVQINQWFEAEAAAQQTRMKNEWDQMVLLEVIQLLGINAPKERVAAYVTERWKENPGSGTVQGLIDLLDLNLTEDSRPHYAREAYEQLEKRLGEVPLEVLTNAQNLVSAWIDDSWLSADKKTVLPEEDWVRKPEDLMAYVDTIIDTLSYEVTSTAYTDPIYVMTPGMEPEDQKWFRTPYGANKAGRGGQLIGNIGALDRGNLTMIEKQFAALQTGVITGISQANRKHLYRLANYRTTVAVDQLSRERALKDLITAQVIPSGWDSGDVEFDPQKDVFQSHLTLNPIIRLHNKQRGEEVYVSWAWSPVEEEEIWTRYNPEAEKDYIVQKGLSEWMYRDNMGYFHVKPLPQFDVSRQEFWKSIMQGGDEEE